MSLPGGGIFVVRGEMSTLMTAMRRNTRWTSHSHHHHPDDDDPLMRGFLEFKELLNKVDDLKFVEPATYLSPFLEVIRSGETTGPVTSLALSAINKFLSYGLIDPTHPSVAKTVHDIADAVTHARFVGTDQSSDGVVLMRILQVLRTLTLAPEGAHLTNESLCEIMLSCFRICFETRLNELLRRTAEHYLKDMVQLVFMRLPQFSDDFRSVAKHLLKMRAGNEQQQQQQQQTTHRSSTGNVKQQRRKSHKIASSNSTTSTGANSASPATPATKKEETTPVPAEKDDATPAGNSTGESATEDASLPAGSAEGVVTSKDGNADLSSPAAVPTSTSDSDVGITTSSNNANIVDMQGSISQNDGSRSQLLAETSRGNADNADSNLVENEADGAVSEGSQNPVPTDHINTAEEAINSTATSEAPPSAESPHAEETTSDVPVKDDEKINTANEEKPTTKQPSTTEEIPPNQEEYVNQRGIRFTTQTQEILPDEDGESEEQELQNQHQHQQQQQILLPYGLACVKELFRFLISLCNPLDKQNNEIMIHLGLTLLTVAFEVGADSIGKHQVLLALVKDDLCRNLFSLLSMDQRLSVFAADLQVSFLMFESLRTHLKYQLELYLTKLIEMITSDSGKITYEHKELALDNIVQLWRIPNLVTELYLNYDCDMYCTNLYEDLTKLLAKNAFSSATLQGGLYHTHMLSLDALLTVIESIERNANNNSTSDDGNTKQKTLSTEDPIKTGNVRPNSDDHDVEHISSFIEKHGGANNSRVKTPDDDLPSKEELMECKNKKKWLPTGTAHFNLKPKKGLMFLQEHGVLSPDPTPHEIALFLRENPGLDKRVIGEYISHRNNLHILEAFVNTFDFTNMRIDEALRHYLETFRLPGEATPISNVMEHFASHWHKSNGEPFADADAAFTLAYAVILLNVDQHNQNVKKQTQPMSLSGFKKNLKGVNGGDDFNEELLDEIYNAIRNEEIIMPAEQTGLVRENYLWKCLLRKGDSPKDGRYMHAASGRFDRELFSLIWGPVVTALSFVYDKSEDPRVYARALRGFRKCARITARFGMSKHLDVLVSTLCKFTTFHGGTVIGGGGGGSSINGSGAQLGSAGSQSAGLSASTGNLSGASSGILNSGGSLPQQQMQQQRTAAAFGANVKARLALKTVIQDLCHEYGDNIREGWANILDLILSLYMQNLLPKVYVEAEDFIQPGGKIVLTYEEPQTMQKQDTGLFSSLYSYMVSGENPGSRAPTAEDAQNIELAKETIRECNFEQIITDSKFLHEASLEELVKALVELSRGPDVQRNLGYSYNENVAVFFLELLIKIVIQNRDRVMTIWNTVRDHIYTLVMNSALFDYQFLLERSVIGLLRIAIRLMRNEDMSPVVLQSLRMLLLLKSSTLSRISRQIAYGLYELLKTSAQNIHTQSDWTIVFTLLECVGAGAQPPKATSMIGDDYLANQQQQENTVANGSNVTCASGTKSDGEGPSVSSDDELGSAVTTDRGYTSDSELTNRSASAASASVVTAGKLHFNSGNFSNVPSSSSGIRSSDSPTPSGGGGGGGWILVGNEGSEIQQPMALLSSPSSPTSPPIVFGRAIVPPDQYCLTLDRHLGAHDPASLMKCCESLAFLVRDVAHITPYNFDDCVHCIRTFVEASLHGNRRRRHNHHQQQQQSSGNKSAAGRGGDGATATGATAVATKVGGGGSSSRRKGAASALRRNRERQYYSRNKSPASSPDEDHHNNEEDDSDSAEDCAEDAATLPTGYHQISIQLLDLMHTLHTRTAQIFKWWAEEVQSQQQTELDSFNSNENRDDNNSGIAVVQTTTSSLWAHGWCPLLQGIARLCCDRRKTVRMSAITYLQRALLVHDLQTLSGPEWEACFHRVLFPLLKHLLMNPIDAMSSSRRRNGSDPGSMEETRMRAAAVLSKVFLHHLTPLLSLPTFPDLWLEILDLVDRYMHADDSDLLLEAIPESLKNMLLVMDSAGVFDEADTGIMMVAGQRAEPDSEQSNNRRRGPLWQATWERIDKFLPGMKEELFRETVVGSSNTGGGKSINDNNNSQSFAIDNDPSQQQQQQQQQRNVENQTAAAATSMMRPPNAGSIILQPPQPAAVATGAAPSSIQSHLFAHLGQMVSTPIPPAPRTSSPSPPIVVTGGGSSPGGGIQQLPQQPTQPPPPSFFQPTLQPGMPYLYTTAGSGSHGHRRNQQQNNSSSSHTFPVLYQAPVPAPTTTQASSSSTTIGPSTNNDVIAADRPPSLYSEYMTNPYNTSVPPHMTANAPLPPLPSQQMATPMATSSDLISQIDLSNRNVNVNLNRNQTGDFSTDVSGALAAPSIGTNRNNINSISNLTSNDGSSMNTLLASSSSSTSSNFFRSSNYFPTVDSMDRGRIPPGSEILFDVTDPHPQQSHLDNTRTSIPVFVKNSDSTMDV